MALLAGERPVLGTTDSVNTLRPPTDGNFWVTQYEHSWNIDLGILIALDLQRLPTPMVSETPVFCVYPRGRSRRRSLRALRATPQRITPRGQGILTRTTGRDAASINLPLTAQSQHAFSGRGSLKRPHYPPRGGVPRASNVPIQIPMSSC